MAELDAVVVGAGPNGLVAAITLAQEGRRVLVVEANARPGGGARSEALMRPDVLHDVCSAIHPLGLASPALRDLPLAEHGLRWIQPDVPVAHPLDDGKVALLHRSIADTAAGLGDDGASYRRLFEPLVRAGFDLTDGLLAPLTLPPRHPIALARYGIHGIRSARAVAGSRFDGDAAQGLFAGLSAHSILSLRTPSTAGYGMMLGLLGHLVGWPMAEGGSQAIADALVSLLESLGGSVECNRRIDSLDALPSADAVLLDLTPRQVVAISGDRLPSRYRRALERFRYGPGVCKVDWVLDGPIPWSAPDCARTATVHVGGTLAEITAAEQAVQDGVHPERPFVLVAQPTLFDTHRAPEGVHTAWAYCHVPNGSTFDMSRRIEAQLERFAPGFRDRITDRHVMLTPAMEAHDANYVGGDIAGGAGDLRQFVARPTFGLHPWRTPVDGLWMCSSSTPPGAGVHGMCGYLAARDVLRR
ncbi:MAG: NAD(P)/FAD-dependent oxidoreductase [Ilumatobacteraceae bacterium]